MTNTDIEHKATIFHEFYKECHDLKADETLELFKKADTEEERDFIRLVTDYMLQQRQKKAIAEKRF